MVIDREDNVPTIDYTELPAVIGRSLQQYVERTDEIIAELSARLAALESR
jgi:hypothetical protein